jgi:DNA-binding transcriptional LysR family regulator
VHIETLKIFCDVVENQSFSLAASQNYITQSAVSQQIRGRQVRFFIRPVARCFTPTTRWKRSYRV